MPEYYAPHEQEPWSYDFIKNRQDQWRKEVGGEFGPSQQTYDYWQDILDKMDAARAAGYPVNYSFELYGQTAPKKGKHMSLGQQVVDFITSPPVLLTLGAGYGMYAGATGAGAGAAGAAEGAGAASVTGASGELAAGGMAAYGGSTAAGAGTAAGTAATAGELTADQWAAGLNANQMAGYEALPAAASAGGSTATTAAGSTALQRILDGSGTTQDYLTLAGQVAPSLLGMYASDKQTDALTGLANKYMAMGEPYRNTLAEISQDPSKFYDSPQAQMATESVLRRLSATHGNVAGSPYAQQLTIDALWDQYGSERDRLAGFGGLTQYNAAAPGAATAAIGSQANFYNALGGGIADVTTPRTQPRTLAEILRAGGYA